MTIPLKWLIVLLLVEVARDAVVRVDGVDVRSSHVGEADGDVGGLVRVETEDVGGVPFGDSAADGGFDADNHAVGDVGGGHLIDGVGLDALELAFGDELGAVILESGDIGHAGEVVDIGDRVFRLFEAGNEGHAADCQ